MLAVRGKTTLKVKTLDLAMYCTFLTLPSLDFTALAACPGHDTVDLHLRFSRDFAFLLLRLGGRQQNAGEHTVQCELIDKSLERVHLVC
jgi:hypothetical protein